MSRFLLLIIFGAWLTWSERAPSSASTSSASTSSDAISTCAALPALLCFFVGYVAVVLLMSVWGRRLARLVDGITFNRHAARFNRAMSGARMFIALWFTIGVYYLGWGSLASNLLAAVIPVSAHLQTPGILVGCLPAFLAWMGLWWAQYPAEIALREQGLLSQINAGNPVHRPPTLVGYFRVNLRLQLLFTLAPILALVGLRDLLALAMQPLHLDESNSSLIQFTGSLLTTAIIFVFSPELLRRVLDTEPLSRGPLRDRLETICRRHGIGFRDVLLWRTEHQMGNAAVMGLIPQVRYILMSDLLLETMTDEQIEAVFAHEVGHVVHRHLLWFAVYFAAAMFAMVCITDPLASALSAWLHNADWPSVAISLLSGAALLVTFFWISRRFERQADVFAGRAMQLQLREVAGVQRHNASDRAVDPSRIITLAGASGMAGIMLQALSEPAFASQERLELLPADKSHVGLYGSTVFAQALHQVARINCIPLHAWSWCHGSMASRIYYLQSLTDDPKLTRNFDSKMQNINLTLMCALALFGAWAAWTLMRGG